MCTRYGLRVVETFLGALMDRNMGYIQYRTRGTVSVIVRLDTISFSLIDRVQTLSIREKDNDY